MYIINMGACLSRNSTHDIRGVEIKNKIKKNKFKTLVLAMDYNDEIVIKEMIICDKYLNTTYTLNTLK
jgi:hypothetical protein